ncbi:PREDICTED: transcription factor bHLH18-like [Lupinus angustifolius]|uniref:transcription factor bHLH18-like n=1 Tax=Lupinus angustifolius TaxID=3871 RepID=UPI00092F7724|nr:PREDICTED: transcription factor bHLH18-like [Lupinus angustifolius]
MEEESWENWHLHMEMNDDIFLEKCHNEDDDEFLREIFLEQPPFSFENETNHSSFQNSPTTIVAAATTAIVDGGVIPPMVASNEHGGEKRPSNTLTPRTCILSFGDSTMKPITHEQHQNNYEHLLGDEEKPSSNNQNKRKFGELRPRERVNKNHVMDHIMAERKRRQDLTERFIALSATIPGLNKTDKASILRAAIDYVKQLQEKVEKLEKEEKNGSESVILIKKSDISGNEESTCSETSCEDCCTLPEIEARVLGNEVLIEIHCEKENGIELKLLDQLENLHLCVTGTSVLPFGNFTLGITVVAQMSNTYNMTVNDLVKNLRNVIRNSHMPCNSDPY